MRVTNKMLTNDFLTDMNTNLQNMQTLQQQMTSGKEVRKPSDDPFKVARVLQLNSDISSNVQYNSNIQDTTNWLNTTDTSLGQVGDSLQRIRALLVSAGNAAYGSDERQSIKDEINQQIGQISQTLNTNFDGQYIFGGTRGTTKPVDTTVDANGNTQIFYYKKGGGALPDPTQIPVTGANASSWNNTTLNLSITGANGSTTNVGVPINFGTNTSPTIDDLIQNLNTSISTDPTLAALKGNLTFGKTTINGSNCLTMTSSPDSDIKILNQTGNPPDVATYLNGADKAVYNSQSDMINSDLSVEISQSVTMNYNVSASNVLQYNNEGGTKEDLRELFQAITNHLDNKLNTSSSSDSTIKNEYTDASTDNPTDKLSNQDLQGITDAINNLLKMRSEVGAKQNRMESAQNKNEAENQNLTTILSKTEDIDITQKTMEYATMQTVYMASLQTSAKVIQPTLLDYLR